MEIGFAFHRRLLQRDWITTGLLSPYKTWCGQLKHKCSHIKKEKEGKKHYDLIFIVCQKVHKLNCAFIRCHSQELWASQSLFHLHNTRQKTVIALN